MKKTLWKQSITYSSVLVAGVAIGFSLLSFSAAGLLYDYEDTLDQNNLQYVDAVVCLSGGRGRINAASLVWYRYWKLANVKNLSALQPQPPNIPKVPIFFVSGMGKHADWNVLEQQVAPEVLTVLTPENVVLETESSNTVENAKFLLAHAQKKKWSKVLMITASYHMKRAKHIFNQISKNSPKPPRLLTLSIVQEPFSQENWNSTIYSFRVTVMEYLKWVYYKSLWGLT